MNRVLKPDGRLALSDIISEHRMPDSIKTDADLWAACIGGAEQVDNYTELIEMLGFAVVEVRKNPQYEFTSDQAQNACQTCCVKSISLEAHKSLCPNQIPIYVHLSKFTHQVIEHVHDSPDRTEEAKAPYRIEAGTWKEFFVTMGRYDGLVVALTSPYDETPARRGVEARP